MQSAAMKRIKKAFVIPMSFCLLLTTSVSAAWAAPMYQPPESKANTDAQDQCDLLADPTHYIEQPLKGPGVDINKIDVAAALPACKKAAHRNLNPHYIALYGLVLRADHRYPEAVKELERAAARGSTLAMIGLGATYGPPESVKWFRKAAGAGSLYAMYILGNEYFDGNRVPQSDLSAIYWWRQAAEGGLPLAMTNVAYSYEYGRGVPQSYSEAYAWYHKAADIDADTLPMLHLGTLYDLGHGVPQDDRTAAVWYRRAADGGNAIAMQNLGVLYQTGRGVPKSFPEAAAWYKKSVDLDFDRAKVNLGFLYQNGWGVAKDLNRADTLYSEASRSKDPAVVSAAKKLADTLRPPTETGAANGGSDAAGIFAALLILAALGQGQSGPAPVVTDTQPRENSNELFCMATAYGVFDAPQMARTFAGCKY